MLAVGPTGRTDETARRGPELSGSRDTRREESPFAMARAARPSPRAWLRAARQDQAGATAIEYALLIAGISVAIVGIVFLLGADIAALFEGIADKISNAKECAQAHQNCGGK